MKKIFIIFVFFILFIIFYSLGKAKAKEKDIFEIEMKLYTTQEIKELFPVLDLRYTNDKLSQLFKNYNYLFGWIRLKKGVTIPNEGGIMSGKWIPTCKITIWNQHFKHTFNIEGITEEKSYFLIPFGTIFISDRNFEYRISTIP